MLQTIWKYELQITDRQDVFMPVGAEVLAFGNQNDTPVIWARVNPESATEPRVFHIVGTGHKFDGEKIGRHVGSAQFMSGTLVWHLFEGASA